MAQKGKGSKSGKKGKKDQLEKAERPETVVPEPAIFTLVVDRANSRYYTSMTGWVSNAELEGVLYSFLRDLIKAGGREAVVEEQPSE